MRRLVELRLNSTRISARGVAQLKALLPGAGISWSERNRVAASAVLALGGSLHIRADGGPGDQVVKATGDLPSTYFRITRVHLAGVAKPLGDLPSKLAALADAEFDALQGIDVAGMAFGDSDLEALPALTTVTELNLASTRVSDVGLHHLKRWPALQRLVLDGLAIRDADVLLLQTLLPELTDLSLSRTQVSEDGLASLKGMKKLRRLVLDSPFLRGPELANNLKGLTDLTELAELRLACPTLTDVHAKQIGELKALMRLEVLSLAGCGVGDETLKQLHTLTGLKELDLAGTRVSTAGVAAAKKALPKCRIVGGPALR
jgi:hypothetical protein